MVFLMFTGLVETVGTVLKRIPTLGGLRLRVGCGSLSRELRRGESIAVDGTCLTVVRKREGWFETQISPETLERTVLGERVPGAWVNLERAVKAGERLGGHLVQAHVDGVGILVEVRPEGESRRIRILPPKSLGRYLVEKGSVALDGVSLTVASRDRRGFEVVLIPHTLAGTTLGKWGAPRRVNMEVDLVAKYVESLLDGLQKIERAPYQGRATREGPV